MRDQHHVDSAVKIDNKELRSPEYRSQARAELKRLVAAFPRDLEAIQHRRACFQAAAEILLNCTVLVCGKAVRGSAVDAMERLELFVPFCCSTPYSFPTSQLAQSVADSLMSVTLGDRARDRPPELVSLRPVLRLVIFDAVKHYFELDEDLNPLLIIPGLSSIRRAMKEQDPSRALEIMQEVLVTIAPDSDEASTLSTSAAIDNNPMLIWAHQLDRKTLEQSMAETLQRLIDRGRHLIDGSFGDVDVLAMIGLRIHYLAEKLNEVRSLKGDT